MRRRTAWALFVVGASMAACSLTSLDGLSGGPDDSATPDATPDGDAFAATEASGDADGGACTANLASDSANCGRCGHDCLGGACNAGACQPVLLASSLPEVFSIALDAKNVYWTGASDKIGRVPKSGGTPAPFATGLSGPAALALDDTNLYVGVSAPDGGGIESRPLGGTGFTLIVPRAVVSRMVVHGDSLFWTDQGAAGGVGSVKRVLRMAPSIVTSLSANETDPRGLAVNTTTVFWTDATSGKVLSCPIAGCGGTAQVLATGQNYPLAIAADDNTVYFAEQTAPFRIRSCPAAGCVGAPADLAVSPAVTAMVATSTALYWVTSSAGTGTVSTCPLSGTGGAPPTVLAPNQNRPYAIAVDDEAIYWGTRGTESATDAAIVKLAR